MKVSVSGTISTGSAILVVASKPFHQAGGLQFFLSLYPVRCEVKFLPCVAVSCHGWCTGTGNSKLRYLQFKNSPSYYMYM